MNYINPELLALIPVLNIIGAVAKTAGLDSRWLPAALGIVSVALCTAWTVISGDGETPKAVLTGIIQGVLVAGAAVYGHQIFKQLKTTDDKESEGNENVHDKD
jgi:hypothetical protein